MKRNTNLYLEDVLISIKLIESYLNKTNIRQLKKDREKQDAIIRRLEIIGEAVKKIPSEIKKKHPKIRWKEISGIRDFLVHVYFGVNLDRVWKIVKDELPNLKKEIKKILSKEK